MAILVSQDIAGNGRQTFDEATNEIRASQKVNYTVVSTTDTTWEQLVKTPELPRIGHFYRGYRITDVQPTSRKKIRFDTKEAIAWSVAVTLEEVKKGEDPAYYPPEISWDAETEEVHCDRDVLTGAKVENTAGEPLILTRPQTVTILNITRYYPATAFSPGVFSGYLNTICGTAFWGFPPYSAKLDRIGVSYELIEVPPSLAYPQGGKVRFAKVAYTVKFRETASNPQPWRASLLNYGTKARPKPGEKPQRALDNMGHPIEVKLAENGTALPDGAEGIYLDFNVYRVTDFSALGIDQQTITTLMG